MQFMHIQGITGYYMRQTRGPQASMDTKVSETVK